MEEGKLFVFSAPSGTGKTSIINELRKDKELKLEFSVSATNRPPREYEKDGEHYYFLSDNDFRQKIKEKAFLEWEEVYEGRFYGSLKAPTEEVLKSGRNIAFDIDIAGGFEVKKQYGKNALLIFIKPPSSEELEKRLKKRDADNAKDIEERLAKAEHELSFADRYDHIIVNDDFDTAVADTKKLMKDYLSAFESD